MWDLPGPGIKPVSLALAGGFFLNHQGSPEFTFDTTKQLARIFTFVLRIIQNHDRVKKTCLG